MAHRDAVLAPIARSPRDVAEVPGNDARRRVAPRCPGSRPRRLARCRLGDVEDVVAWGSRANSRVRTCTQHRSAWLRSGWAPCSLTSMGHSRQARSRQVGRIAAIRPASAKNTPRGGGGGRKHHTYSGWVALPWRLLGSRIAAIRPAAVLGDQQWGDRWRRNECRALA